MIIQKVNDLIPKAFAELKSFQLGEKKIVKTGFDCIDSHIGGLLNGDIAIIAGLSSHGRTAHESQCERASRAHGCPFQLDPRAH